MNKRNSKREYQVPNVRFSHFRCTNDESDSRTVPGNLFTPNGGATIAYVTAENGKVYVAAAYCHPYDNFNADTGRVKADGRLAALLNNEELKDENRYFIGDGSDDGAFLGRVRDTFVGDFGYVTREYKRDGQAA